MTALVHPALLVTAFAPIGGREADARAAHDRLGRLWGAAGRLGMDDPLLDDLPIDFPAPPSTDEPAFRLLAGRSHTDGGVSQAYLFSRHDAIGLAAALTSGATEEPWRWWVDALRRWEDAVGDSTRPASLLGETYVFLAHVDRPADGLPRLGDEVAATLHEAGLGAWEPPFRTADGACLWWWRDPSDRRVIAILAHPGQEETLSRWIWWQEPREAATGMLYLLHAAKLDYEARVYRERRRDMAASLHAIDAGLDAVLALHGRIDPARGPLPALAAAQDRLIQARGMASAVVIDLTYLRALRRTVGIARRNLAAGAPSAAAGVDPSGESMFARDQALSAWLEEQIDQDVGYAEAVIARAREAQDLTMLRLEALRTRIARAQSRIGLMQTSLVSALVAGLGWVTVMDISFDPPEPVRVPLLAFFVALLLALPVLAAHWFEPYGRIDRLSAVMLGAVSGWLAVAAVAGFVEWPIVLAAGGAGALAGLALLWLHDRAHRPDRLSEPEP